MNALAASGTLPLHASREIGLRSLLILFMVLLTAGDVFGWQVSLGPGLSTKNAMLYLLIMLLAFRFAVQGETLQARAITACFLLLILYAIVSYVIVVLGGFYSRYNVIDNGILLKNLVDNMLFFLVFFYGVRSDRAALSTLKWLLATVALAHVMAMLNALDIITFGDIEQRGDGRVQGFVGESNQYGAFVAMSLPAMASLALVTRGAQRTFWVLLAAMTAITLVMTVSRGAFVATLVAGAAALVMFRRYIPKGRLPLIALAAVFSMAVAAVLAIVLGFGDLLYARLIGEASSDLGSTSSGRTEIWTDALAVMIENPLTLLSGYGWRSYWSMPFRYSPHNQYLNFWFNLGLVGLGCVVLLFVLPIRTAREAIERGMRATSFLMMGFIVATIALATAIFFVDLYTPWVYYWAYAGLAMRLAANALQRAPQQAAPPEPESPPTTAVDPYGWSGVGVSRVRSARPLSGVRG